MTTAMKSNPSDSPLGSYWRFSGRYLTRVNPGCRCGKLHVFKIYVSPDGEEWPLMMPAGTPVPQSIERKRNRKSREPGNRHTALKTHRHDQDSTVVNCVKTLSSGSSRHTVTAAISGKTTGRFFELRRTKSTFSVSDGFPGNGHVVDRGVRILSHMTHDVRVQNCIV